MKKITVMLSSLLLFTAGSLFAQSRPADQVSLNYEEIKYKIPVSLPATKALVTNKAAVTSATPAQATSKTIAGPEPAKTPLVLPAVQKIREAVVRRG